jgi:y4mF family transcriptional regulator
LARSAIFPIGKIGTKYLPSPAQSSRAGRFRWIGAPEAAIFPSGKTAMTPTELGKTIRTARLAAGLRQDELAGAANVGARFVVELEAGKPTAQLGKTLAVLGALGCRVSVKAPKTRRT